ncbi:hypothetical protein BpHYR1_051797 [Brachionus plicatilis]|uniref:Uncharacterized protein n=1 Tax=Brachionus plicatilis TaxID=10195 RepID=A0A3M7PA18_BRAPC|nr:hypothetical protein BpHYR1_051797 [Brachionus plicatilis]
MFCGVFAPYVLKCESLATGTLNSLWPNSFRPEQDWIMSFKNREYKYSFCLKTENYHMRFQLVGLWKKSVISDWAHINSCPGFRLVLIPSLREKLHEKQTFAYFRNEKNEFKKFKNFLSQLFTSKDLKFKLTHNFDDKDASVTVKKRHSLTEKLINFFGADDFCDQLNIKKILTYYNCIFFQKQRPLLLNYLICVPLNTHCDATSPHPNIFANKMYILRYDHKAGHKINQPHFF